MDGQGCELFGEISTEKINDFLTISLLCGVLGQQCLRKINSLKFFDCKYASFMCDPTDTDDRYLVVTSHERRQHVTKKLPVFSHSFVNSEVLCRIIFHRETDI